MRNVDADALIEDFKERIADCDKWIKDELNRVSKELNSEIEKSKSEIVPDYRDGCY